MSFRIQAPTPLTAVVVGHGPAGCAVALGLARAGVSVRILERNEDGGLTGGSGPVFISPSGKTGLAVLGAPLDKIFAGAGVPLNVLSVRFGTTIARVDITHLNEAGAALNGCVRKDLAARMRELTAAAGIPVETGVKVSGAFQRESL